MRISRSTRGGWTSVSLLVTGVSLLALAGLALALLLLTGSASNLSSGTSAELLVYCAAGMKPPVEAIAREYQRECGQSVQLQFGGSGTLLSNLRLGKIGDVFLAADESYLEIAKKQGLVAETIPIAEIRPAILVAKGNPKHIATIADLSTPGIKVCWANPESASVGQTTKTLLEQTGDWKKIASNITVFKPTVTDVANDVKLGTVDAGVVWDTTALTYPELDAVRTPELDSAKAHVAIGVLRTTKNPTAALRFVRYLTASNRGSETFDKFGYRILEQDTWTETPRLVLYSGGVNRLAIESTVRRFEAREGAIVQTVYNGCGILTAQMRAGQRPDAYFSCDQSFFDQVSGMFATPTTLSETRMVILTRKGNPRSIHSLADLATPGLALGFANRELSALGALTRRTLERIGLYENVRANVRVESPTADLLLGQMLAGSLDAVIVYAANASQVRDKFDVVPIAEPDAKATQPFAIGLDSHNKRLAGRLLSALESVESRELFENSGFQWLGPTEAR